MFFVCVGREGGREAEPGGGGVGLWEGYLPVKNVLVFSREVQKLR